MSYREHPAPPALADWLQCTWERAGDGPPVRVLPDGCIDVVWTQGAATQIVGANSTAFVVDLPAGTRVVGARLHPGAAPALLGVSAEAVRDARLVIADAWGEEGQRLAATLDGDDDPAECLRAALLARAARAQRPDALVGEVVARLRRPGPEGAVARLAADLGVSERQLRRRVCSAVGYGPKRLARVLRLERALQAARSGDELARVALDAGYADQAHFTNDCRALAGLTPAALLSHG